MKKTIFISCVVLTVLLKIHGINSEYSDPFLSHNEFGLKLVLIILFITIFFSSVLDKIKKVQMWKVIKLSICLFLSNMVLIMMINFFFTSKIEIPEIGKLNHDLYFLSFLDTVVIAPIFEEFFYRSALIWDCDKNNKKWMTAVSSIISLLLFTFSHVGNTQGQGFNLLTFFIFGSILTVIQIREKNI